MASPSGPSSGRQSGALHLGANQGNPHLGRSFICGAPDLPADRVPKIGFQMGTPDWLPDGVPQINTKMGLTQIDSQMEVLQMGF